MLWSNFSKYWIIKVQKLKDVSNHENNIFSAKPLEIFVHKVEVCDMTLMSIAFDKSMFDGNTNLLKISEKTDKHR